MIQIIKAFVFGIPIKGQPVKTILTTTHTVEAEPKKEFNNWSKEIFKENKQ